MTAYNGSRTCQRCGGQILPQHAMIDPNACPPCRRQKDDRHVRRKMVDDGR